MITYLCTWQSGAPMRLEMNQGKYYKKKESHIKILTTLNFRIF